MADNSPYPRRAKPLPRLRPGRFPELIRPSVPYRIDEWGKSRRVALPEGLKPGPLTSPEPFAAIRGRPGLGTLVVYVGEETMHPLRTDGGFPARTVKQGYARTEPEARLRAEKWIRRRIAEIARKANISAAAKSPMKSAEGRFSEKSVTETPRGLNPNQPDGDGQGSGSGFASLAKSSSRAGKRGT